MNFLNFIPDFLLDGKIKQNKGRLQNSTCGATLLIEKFKSVYLPVYARKKVGHGVDSGVIISDL